MSYPSLTDELSTGIPKHGGTLVFVDLPNGSRRAHCHVCDWLGIPTRHRGQELTDCPACGTDYGRLLAEIDAELDELSRRRAEEARGAKLGRNDPCWCGSERKFKKCHGGA